MDKDVRSRLNDYYTRMKIHPDHFRCPHQSICRQYAYQGKMTEAKMSMVGSQYGQKYPRIAVVSLDPPNEEDGAFQSSTQRTTEYVSRLHETEDFFTRRPNPHWAMTQIIVKDLLACWGYVARPGAVVVTESYSGRPIENVSAFFAHVNVAKCSMNNEGRRQAQENVHLRCSHAYLRDELMILGPDILITQGAATNKILGRMLVGREILTSDLPKIEVITLDHKKVLWFPMHHPTQQLDKIRAVWPEYLRAAKNWASKNPIIT